MKAAPDASIDLSDVVRRFGPAYVASRGEAILPSQKKALSDIANCHTEKMGGRRYCCEDCGENFWVYHGCRNRACPACHGRFTRQWVAARQGELLGCGYYHVVATVPAPLRAAFLANQKLLYGLFLKTVSECVIDLVRDPRYVGGLPAVLAVLHTWASDLQFHPHAHLLVSAGGLSADGEHWIEPRHSGWLVPIWALSALVRGRFRAHLKRVAPQVEANLPISVWAKGWNVFCKPCGSHSEGVVAYLGRYIFRTAISNARIESMDETHVTFRFKSRRKGQGWSRLRLRGEEFLRRFVMHVLPRGFQKVRYYGLWHHSKSGAQKRIAEMLRLTKGGCCNKDKFQEVPGRLDILSDLAPSEESTIDDLKGAALVKCPHCSSTSVHLNAEIRRGSIRSP